VTQDAEESEMKFNYLRLSRMVHPDKCKHPDAAEASATLNQAKDTLMNPLKKRLYDAYLDDMAKGQGVNKEEYTYAEWEAKMSQMPVKLPGWLVKLLQIPGMAWIIMVLMLLLMIPLFLLLVLLVFVLWLLLLPINILFRCCCPDRLEEARKKMENEMEQEEGDAYVPPETQNV